MLILTNSNVILNTDRSKRKIIFEYFYPAFNELPFEIYIRPGNNN
jgi:hypothetical protein